MMTWRPHLNLYHYLVTAVHLNPAIVSYIIASKGTIVYMHVCFLAFSVEAELKSHLLTALNGSSTEEL